MSHAVGVKASSTGVSTAVGFGAIVMWSSLGALTQKLGSLPPFELMAITFGIGGAAGLTIALLRGQARRFRQRPIVWLLGIGGVFGDYGLYFWSLRLAPPAQANLLSYLWPLLMVLFSALLPHEHLRARHFAGAALGFAGVVVLIMGAHADLGPQVRYLPGYGLALGAAFVWAGYSVLARRFGEAPHEITFGFCLGAAALATVAHVTTEPNAWPSTPLQMVILTTIGLGPAGLAFFLWDLGIRHGDIRLLGILSYLTPLLSTTLLVATGAAEPTASLAIAGLLISSGAICGASRPVSSDQRSPEFT